MFDKYCSIDFIFTSAGTSPNLPTFIWLAKTFRLQQMILQLLQRPFSRFTQLHVTSIKREPILSLRKGFLSREQQKFLQCFDKIFCLNKNNLHFLLIFAGYSCSKLFESFFELKKLLTMITAVIRTRVKIRDRRWCTWRVYWPKTNTSR